MDDMSPMYTGRFVDGLQAEINTLRARVDELEGIIFVEDGAHEATKERAEVAEARVAELEAAWLTDEAIQPDGSLRPSVFDTVKCAKTAEAERDALAARVAELETAYKFHPRAMKLIAKRKNFLVVAEDEPYFIRVYNLIREHEKEIGRWTNEDEGTYWTVIVRLP